MATKRRTQPETQPTFDGPQIDSKARQRLATLARHVGFPGRIVQFAGSRPGYLYQDGPIELRLGHNAETARRILRDVHGRFTTVAGTKEVKDKAGALLNLLRARLSHG